METLECCPLCGGRELKRSFSLPDAWFRTDEIFYTMLRCGACGLSMLSPRPTEEEIGRYYPANYYRTDRDPIEQWEPYLSRKAELLPKCPGRLLDIGAQKGEFLEVCRRRGWNVHGVEISSEIPNPYSVPMTYGRAWDVEFPPASFDAVTMWHVFEHIRRPKELLAAIRIWLKPGGRLLIAVPNAASLQHRVMHVEDIPRHLFAYSESSLDRILRESGFAPERFDYSDQVHEQNMNGIVTMILRRDLLREDEIGLLKKFYNEPDKFESFAMKLIDRPISKVLGMIVPAIGMSRNLLVHATRTV